MKDEVILIRGTKEVHATVQELAEFIAESLDESVDLGTWNRPWRDISRTMNPISEHEFSLTNSFLLWKAMKEQGYSSPLWANYHQWNREGGRVKRGEKATKILIPDLRNIDVDDGDSDDEHLYYEPISYKIGHYFNIEQTINIKKKYSEQPFVESKPYAELIVRSNRIDLRQEEASAYYRCDGDYINMPPPSFFVDTDEANATENYYGTLLHECVHWTGHKSRLKRKMIDEFGSESYAFEELIAEFGASRLCIDLKVSPYIREDHRQYIAWWAEKIRAHPNEFLGNALAKASSAANYLLQQTAIHLVADFLPAFHSISYELALSILAEDLPEHSEVISRLVKRKILKKNELGELERGPKWPDTI